MQIEAKQQVPQPPGNWASPSSIHLHRNSDQQAAVTEYAFMILLMKRSKDLAFLCLLSFFQCLQTSEFPSLSLHELGGLSACPLHPFLILPELSMT